MRTRTVIFAAALMLGVALMSTAGAAALRTEREASKARAQLESLRLLASELLRLRAAGAERVNARPRATGLQPRVAAVIASCGLPATVLNSLSPESESATSNGQDATAVRRQRATLVLGPVLLREFGAFLGAWRTAEPDWTITAIELSRQDARSSEAAGGELALRAVVQMETLFSVDPAPELSSRR